MIQCTQRLIFAADRSLKMVCVLDADAFQAFKEKELFDKETESKFRKYVLESGATKEAMELYKSFRCKEPSRDPLLER